MRNAEQEAKSSVIKLTDLTKRMTRGQFMLGSLITLGRMSNKSDARHAIHHVLHQATQEKTK
jgi:hypothetical protein